MTEQGRPDILLVSDEETAPFDSLREYLAVPLPDIQLDRFPHMPYLGAVLLGTHLRRRGLRPVVIDNLSRIPANASRFREVLRGGVPVVGISTSLLFDVRTVGGLVAEIRRLNPKAVVVLGGHTAALYPAVSALGDATVKGYAEGTLPELVMALREGRSLEELPNLILNRSGRQKHTAERAELWPGGPLAPDWDLLQTRHSECFPIEASRGCRHKCRFCLFSRLGRDVRREPGSVIAEMARDHEKYGARFLRFTDPNFTSCPEKAEHLCERITASRLGASWSCYARVDDLAKRPGLGGAMRQAGCVAAFMGVESGDDGMLAAMAKGYDSAAVLEGIRRAKEAGLITCANFIIGFPGETSDTVERTLELIDKAEPDLVAFNVHVLRRGSPAWESRSGLGLEGENLKWRHATMDSEQAQAHMRRAMEAVVRTMPRVSIGTELMMIRYVSHGLSVHEAMDYFRAAKEWHAGSGRCGPWASDVLSRVGDRLLQVQRRWGLPASAEESEPASRQPRSILDRLRRFMAGSKPGF